VGGDERWNKSGGAFGGEISQEDVAPRTAGEEACRIESKVTPIEDFGELVVGSEAPEQENSGTGASRQVSATGQQPTVLRPRQACDFEVRASRLEMCVEAGEPQQSRQPTEGEIACKGRIDHTQV